MRLFAILSWRLFFVCCPWPSPATERIFACGTFDGKFQCKATPGAAPIGKNVTPGAIDSASPEEPPQAPPDGTWQSTTSTPPAAEVPACKMRQGGLKDCCCLTYGEM